MPNPSRDTTAGQVYNDLRNLARKSGRLTEEVMTDYLLERFLFRMAATPSGRDHFVLKGGLLLAQFGARRTTRDIDILGHHFSGDEGAVVERITRFASLEVDDGVVFDVDKVRSVLIREDELYQGLRLVMPAMITTANLKLQLDISFGDPVTPDPQLIDYQQQLSEETFQLFGYPIATVIAEKLSTAVSLGALNTLDRDYADLYRLVTLHEFDAEQVGSALDATAAHRGIDLQKLSPLPPSDYPEQRQSPYAAWRRRQGPVASAYPEKFSGVVEVVSAFADPLLDGSAAGLTWSPEAGAWS